MNSDGRSGVKKFNNKYEDTWTYICNDNDYYACDGCGYGIAKINTNRSGIGNYIVDYFEGIESTTLTGNCSPNRFTTKRLIIIEMK